MKVRLHTPIATGHGRDEVTELHASPPHVHFHEDGRAELRWSASDNAAHTHNRIVRVEVPADAVNVLAALVSRCTRRAYGQDEQEPPPPPPAPEGEAFDDTAPHFEPPEKVESTP